MAFIYGDIIVLENFIMNYIIICITARFSKIKTNIGKMFMGAIIGAIYTILVYIPSMNFLSGFEMKICLSILMIVIVFTPKGIRDFIRSITIFYLISFIFGGTAFALIYMTNRGGLSSKGFFYIYDFPIILLVLTCVVGYFTIRFSWDYIQRKITKESILTTICIHIDGKDVQTIGIFDTANFLYDPISKLPVIIADYQFIQEILPEEINHIFMNHNENDFEQITKVLVNSDWINRFRMIPYSSIGQQNGLLVAFKTDKIVVFDKGEKKEVMNVIMAIYSHRLSKNGEYNVLLHPEILNMQS